MKQCVKMKDVSEVNEFIKRSLQQTTIASLLEK